MINVLLVKRWLLGHVSRALAAQKCLLQSCLLAPLPRHVRSKALMCKHPKASIRSGALSCHLKVLGY